MHTDRQREAVERGARKLDEVMPGWERTIRRAMTEGYFDMSAWEKCVAGTLELVSQSNPMEDADDLGVYIQLNGTKLSSVYDAEHYGFLPLDGDEELNAWEELDGLWREQVQQRVST